MTYTIKTIEGKFFESEVEIATSSLLRATEALTSHVENTGPDLKKLDFFGETFIGLDLNEVDLSGSRFLECFFYDCKLMECNLTSVDFQGSIFRKCDFSDSDLTDINFVDTDFPNSLHEFHLSDWFMGCTGIFYMDTNFGEMIFTNSMVKVSGQWEELKKVSAATEAFGEENNFWLSYGQSMVENSQNIMDDLKEGKNPLLKVVVDNSTVDNTTNW